MRSHPYLPNSAKEIKETMMKEIGIDNVDELYSDIPEKLRHKESIEIPGPFSELDVKRIVLGYLQKNQSLRSSPFIGGGVWPHYVPAVVDEIVNRAEFLTSYTPYQPEISQGMLQALFEYQSLISELVGLEVANSSMYDWASALGEAARMASRLTHKNKVLVPYLISPQRLSVLKVYTETVGMSIVQVDFDTETGQLDLEDLKEKVDEKTAAVYIENPSFLGFVEEGVDFISEIAHDVGSLFVVGVDPLSLGLLRPPGDYDADIVVGEGQPLGNHMNYGGPLLGLFACRDDPKMIRQLPGRVIGLTETVKGSKRGFTMALQTREQHIRREKATSNICTNEALCAVAAAAYLSLLGPSGIRDIAKLIACRANYGLKKLEKLSGVKAPFFNSFHFKEFTVYFEDLTVHEVQEKLLNHRIQAGSSLVNDFPEFGETALFCVTEMHSKEDIDQLFNALREVKNEKF